MKTRIAVTFIVALVIALTAFTIPTAAQVTLQAGGGIGLVFPQADYGGSTIDYYNGTKYGLGSGFNVHAKGRIVVVGFRLAGKISYSSLSNDGNSEPGQGKVEVSHSHLSVKVGPEFHLAVPLMPFTPYLGANVALNRIGGETTFQGVSRVSSATYSMESATRLGLGLTGGLLVSFRPLTSLDINVGYNLVNLSGKEWKDMNPTQDQRIDTYLALNDEKDPAYAPSSDRHVVSSARNIHTLEIKATILFGL
jgi:opacity protein-like surface antigen